MPPIGGADLGDIMNLRSAIRISCCVIIALASGTTATWAREGPWRIGWLDPSVTPTSENPSPAVSDFEQRLSELGYIKDRDFVIEGRFGDTYWDRLPEYAKDLVDRRVDVIVTIDSRLLPANSGPGLCATPVTLPPGMCEAFDQTQFQRLAGSGHDDRDRRGRLLGIHDGAGGRFA